MQPIILKSRHLYLFNSWNILVSFVIYAFHSVNTSKEKDETDSLR